MRKSGLTRWNQSKRHRKILFQRATRLPGPARPVPSDEGLSGGCTFACLADQGAPFADVLSVQSADSICDGDIFFDINVSETWGHSCDKIPDYANLLHSDSGGLDPFDELGITAVVRNIHQEESAHGGTS